VAEISYRLYNMLAGGWRRRYAIATPILLLPLFGLAVGMMAPDKYRAHTSLLIQEPAKMNPFLEDLAVSYQLNERLSALQTLLHSRHILGAVAEERGLVGEGTSARDYDRVIGQISAKLSMSMVGKELVRIQYEDTTPVGMEAMLTTVSEHFVEQLLAPARSSVNDSASFLAELLEQRRADLDSAETRLAAFKDANPGALPEQHNSNLTRLAALRRSLAEREAELAGAEQALGSLDQQLSQTNPVIGRIEGQIVTLRGELATLRSRYTDSHSQVLAVLRQLARLEQERERQLHHAPEGAELGESAAWVGADAADNGGEHTLLVSQRVALQETRSRVVGMREEVQRLQQLIAELQAQTRGYGEQEQRLSALERDLKVSRQLYEELLQRYEMARVTGSLGSFEQSKRVKLIDRPYTPSAPINPPPLLFVIGGLFGGIALGIGLAVVLELTDSTLRTKRQLMNLAGVPVISRIPPLPHLN